MSYTHGTAENETEHGYVATANRIMRNVVRNFDEQDSVSD